MTTENISFTLDYTTRAETLNYEHVGYEPPALIVTAIPDQLGYLRAKYNDLSRELDRETRSWERYAARYPDQATEEADAANEYDTARRDELEELSDQLNELEKFQVNHTWIIELDADEDILYRFLDRPKEDDIDTHAKTEAAAALRTRPDWFPESERENLEAAIRDTLEDIYKLYVNRFEEYLDAHHNITLDAYRFATDEPNRLNIFCTFWSQY